MGVEARGVSMAAAMLLALLFALLRAIPTFAADYYVSPTGSDIGPGTLAQPFATLAGAQQAASSGDTVYLRGGTYSNFTVAATDATYQYVVDFNKSNR